MGAVVAKYGTQRQESFAVDSIVRDLEQSVRDRQDHDGRISMTNLQHLLTDASRTNSRQQGSTFTVRQAKDMLALCGILDDDPRVQEEMKMLESGDGTMCLLDWESICNQSVLITRALAANLIIGDFEDFTTNINAMYHEVLKDESGENADYIPQLSEKKVDPKQFGISICTIDGQRYNIGDTDVRFGVQSCSKAISYCIAQKLHNGVNEAGQHVEVVHKHVGMEPSGRPFNEMCLDERAKKEDESYNKLVMEGKLGPKKPRKVRPAIPHNPMINAGAIMVSSMLYREDNLADRFDKVMEVWCQLAGSELTSPSSQRPSFANSMYLSEQGTADRNFCLGYMMQQENAFMEGTDLNEALNLYFMMCSIEMSSKMMSCVAATLANGGVNPFTGIRVFEKHVVRNTLSLMGSCGMYDYSGEFTFSMGFPAKSGVGGGIMIVIPGIMGICTFSPRLDKIGNSARGVAFCKALSEKYKFHNYDWLIPRDVNTAGDGSPATPAGLEENPIEKEHPVARNAGVASDEQTIGALLWASYEGNQTRVTELLMQECAINSCDYDQRTPLHLAASEGHFQLVQYMIANGADPKATDRMGYKPIEDAKRELATLRALKKKTQEEEDKINSLGKVVQFLKSNQEARNLDDMDKQLVALGSKDGSTISTRRLLKAIENVGVSQHDPRVKEALRFYPEELKKPDFDSVFTSHRIIAKCLQGRVVLQDFEQLKHKFGAIFQQCVNLTDGENAQYAPSLREQQDKWGVAVCSVDGQRMMFGDAKDKFSVQACHKVITYAIALEETSINGVDIQKYIGREPSGYPAHEIVLDERYDPPIPHNPYVNAGAIMAGTLIEPAMDSEARINYVLEKYWSRLAGEQPSQHTQTYDQTMFEEEVINGDRNRCLAYRMKDAGSFPQCQGPQQFDDKALRDNLDFYFKSCSIVQDCDSLSVVAATLANGGICPITGQRVLKDGTVRDCLSMMYSCGVSDISGEFAFTIGFPAKSSASGALMVVIPNKMGIVTYSPKLDTAGANSRRGLLFCTKLSKAFNFHIYDRLPGTGDARGTSLSTTKLTADAKGAPKNWDRDHLLDLEKKWDPTQHNGSTLESDIGRVIEAASKGDKFAVLLEHSVHGAGLLNQGDYDKRTALHLACEEGHFGIVNYICAQDLDLEPQDRWGKVPLVLAKEQYRRKWTVSPEDQAREKNFKHIVERLEKAIDTRQRNQNYEAKSSP